MHGRIHTFLRTRLDPVLTKLGLVRLSNVESAMCAATLQLDDKTIAELLLAVTDGKGVEGVKAAQVAIVGGCTQTIEFNDAYERYREGR